ncbi:GNAT family N-acetyltransferase [Maribrevibacterium harenarium]|uniref:GNAT family N-acetyltransferase n=1 Tax=Maribrevibacterium harenarium TaxID=2589817 RepID=A0A501WHE4_9GAMM|nr:peptidase C39 family protein [Maribrevibacterium harenarium]TPE46497.1 GNAT family N-acetyltransferase [Maribrevibacterium harenarium]
MSSPSLELNLPTLQVRTAVLGDLDDLEKLENQAFRGDRMSRRSLRHGIKSNSSVMLVAYEQNQLNGYALVHLFKGRLHARLYSLAVSTQARGKGVGKALLQAAEEAAAQQDCISLRLEVSEFNTAAIRLYEQQGYKVFGRYLDYYEDASNAIRMLKRLRYRSDKPELAKIPYVAQRTPFTCGPASLLMALSAQQEIDASLAQELAIWREATSIYMTSGHGGCHPFGLAIAAVNRKIKAEVWVNDTQPLFTDGVRDDLKKTVLETTHQSFLAECQRQAIPIHYLNFGLAQLEEALNKGQNVITLISTYRLNGNKAPHWVLVTGQDSRHIYIHDPDMEKHEDPMDFQHVPIRKTDFDKMSQYGKARLRTMICLQTI